MPASLVSSGLDANQQKVVTEPGHVLCVAGPGSGKTRTLIAKIGYLWQQGFRSLCVVTFTRASAEELRIRLRQEFGKEVAEKVLIGTFHKLAINQLQNCGRPVSLITNTEQRNFMRLACEEVSYAGESEEASRIIETAKSSLDQLDDPFGLVRSYQKRLESAEKQDLFDVMRNCVLWMRQGDIPTPKYDHLMIDEFQDCDEVQFGWMKCHAQEGAVVTVVGDDDQTIYGFRSSLGYQGMVDFKEQLHAQEIHLDINYRSHSEIVEHADKLIRNNRNRIAKTYHPFRGPGGQIKRTQYSSPAAQATSVVDNIKAMAIPVEIGNDTMYAVQRSQVGVIARINTAMLPLLIQLRSNSILFKFDKPSAYPIEIAVAFSLFRCLISPNVVGVESAMRYLLVPAGVLKIFHQEYEAELMNLAVGQEAKLPDLNPKVEPAVKQIQNLIRFSLIAIQNRDLDMVIDLVWNFLKDNHKRNHHTRNLPELILMLRQSMKNARGNLLRRVELLDMSGDNSKKFNDPTNKLGPVELHTMHSCKGLEFDTVFLVDINSAVIPAKKSTDPEEERRLMFVGLTRSKQSCHVLSSDDVSPYALEIFS